MEMVELLKMNGQMLEAEKEKEVKMDALKKELSQVQKDLEKENLKVVQVEELQEKLGQANKKANGLEAEVEQLRWKVEEAKNASVAEYKESINYRMLISTSVTQFLAKERIKMRRLL